MHLVNATRLIQFGNTFFFFRIISTFDLEAAGRIVPIAEIMVLYVQRKKTERKNIKMFAH